MTRPEFQLERNAFGRLVLTDAGGRRHEGVLPVRAFPIAAPEEGVSLVGPDGHELVWITHLDRLAPTDRALIDEEMAAREFVPEIRRLKSVSTFSTPSIWTVETDRGDTAFVLKTEEDIRRLGRTALLITGGEGVHFMVRDLPGMDRASKRLLERFL